jgi:hypothetical protein
MHRVLEKTRSSQRHGGRSRELSIPHHQQATFGGSHGDIWNPYSFLIESSGNASSSQAPWHIKVACASVVSLVYPGSPAGCGGLRFAQAELAGYRSAAATTLVLHEAVFHRGSCRSVMSIGPATHYRVLSGGQDSSRKPDCSPGC